MRLALTLTTYNRPDALAVVLASIARQRVTPDEIVIADDGSEMTAQGLLARFASDSTVPVRLVSQHHEGFRAARLRNLAIAATTCDYLLFVDGDMLLHPEFVADHRRFARPGFFTQGVRVLADAGLTRSLLTRAGRLPTAGEAGLGMLRRAYLLRAPRLSGFARRLANGLLAVKSCNFGAWRADLLRVNGFDEDFIGWGPEDKELAARLGFAGVRRQSLLLGGVAVHLHHPPSARDSLPANRARLETTRRERRTRCERGVDSHLR